MSTVESPKDNKDLENLTKLCIVCNRPIVEHDQAQLKKCLRDAYEGKRWLKNLT